MNSSKSTLILFLSSAMSMTTAIAQDRKPLPAHMSSEAIKVFNSFAGISWTSDKVDQKSCVVVKTDSSRQLKLMVGVHNDYKGPKEQPVNIEFAAFSDPKDYPRQEGYMGTLDDKTGEIQHFSRLKGDVPISIASFPVPPDVRKALMSQDPISACSKIQQEKLTHK